MTNSYISLQEASKLTPYDANYLGLLIRKNRLSAIKKEGKWYTTKEVVLQYLDRVNQKSPHGQTSPENTNTSWVLMSAIFVPLAIIIVVAAFVFGEGRASEKGTFNITKSESTLSDSALPTAPINSQ